MNQLAATADPVGAWRVEFRRGGGASPNCVADFPEPLGYAVVADPAPVAEVMAEPSVNGQSDGKSTLFLFVPAALDFAPYESWFRQGQAQESAEAVLDVAKPDRILWRHGRAVMHGTPERRDEILHAVAIFEYLESELRDLETSIRRNYAVAPKDTRFTHRLTGKALREWPRIGELTEWASLSRLKFMVLDSAFYMPAETLTARGRRMLQDLAKSTRMPDRMELVDDHIQVFEELYRLANDRLSEFRYYRAELVLEVSIIAILAVEVAMMLIGIVKSRL